MVAPEAHSLLRITKSNIELAKSFAAFCRDHQIKSPGAKVSRGPRGLRGLCATRDLRCHELVVAVPKNATLSVCNAKKNSWFAAALPPAGRMLLSTPVNDMKRFPDGFLFQSQYLLGVFLAFLTLDKSRVVDPESMRAYVEFLPRHEGYFAPLTIELNRVLDSVALCTATETTFAHIYGVSAAEVRQVILWCLCMVLSRQLLLSDNEQIRQVSGLEFYNPASSSTCSMSVLCPVMDLCNHGKNENAEINFDGDSFVLSAVKDIAAGEEIIIEYTRNPAELAKFWGMAHVL